MIEATDILRKIEVLKDMVEEFDSTGHYDKAGECEYEIELLRRDFGRILQKLEASV